MSTAMPHSPARVAADQVRPAAEPPARPAELAPVESAQKTRPAARWRVREGERQCRQRHGRQRATDQVRAVVHSGEGELDAVGRLLQPACSTDSAIQDGRLYGVLLRQRVAVDVSRGSCKPTTTTRCMRASTASKYTTRQSPHQHCSDGRSDPGTPLHCPSRDSMDEGRTETRRHMALP